MTEQRRFQILVIGIAALFAIALGCTNDSNSAAPIETPADTESPSSAPTPTKATHSAKPSPSVEVPSTFDPTNFGAQLSHVNPWLPMTSGVQSVRRGFVTVGSRRIPHIRITTVTDVTKKINGVRAVLVLDQDVDDGQVTETAIDYLAQDDGGNVWYLGSYTEAYEAGRFLNAEDAWLAGVNGAEVGLYFPGDPKVGAPPFMQVSIDGGEQSSAQVVKVGAKTCVPYDCFTDVVVVVEDASEHKYWAPGIGGVLTEPLSGASQETEELINLKELSASVLSELSKEAMRLDAHAAVVVPSIFGSSNPAVRER
jgi:hypothetical protein